MSNPRSYNLGLRVTSRFCISWCLIQFAVLATAQSIAQTIARDLDSSRGRLPAFGGVYLEELRVPGGGEETKEAIDNGGRQLTWGDHDSDLRYSYTVGRKGSYQKVIGDSNKLWATLSEQDLCEAGGCKKSVSGGSQGAISKRTPGTINAAAAGYEVRMGETFANLIRADPNATFSGGTLHFATIDGKGTINLDVAHFGNQIAISRFEQSYQGYESTMHVAEWLNFKGARFPKRVVETLAKDGQQLRTATYSLENVEKDPEKQLVWPGWREGAIVTDNETGLHYRWLGGKLVMAVEMNRASAREELTKRLAFLGAFLLVGLGSLAWIRKRRPILKPVPHRKG